MEDKIKLLENLKDELQKLKPLTETETKRLQEDFTIEYTYNTNAIEGNTITLDETRQVIIDGLTIGGKSVKEHLEIIGHKEAFDFIVELGKDKKQMLTEKIIKEIHSLVLMNDRENKGKYRNILVRVGSHTPPQPYMIEPLMEELIINYNRSDEETIEKIARFHLDFEMIHPFIDGNGRTGRLILNLELIKEGYMPIDIKFKDRADYYKAFDDYQKNGSIQSMLDLVVKYEEEELRRYIEAQSYK